MASVMIGAVERYTADQIQVITFEEHVRARPAMYFRVGKDSPELPTEVLQQVVWDALHHSETVRMARSVWRSNRT